VIWDVGFLIFPRGCGPDAGRGADPGREGIPDVRK
jgi:hypothetical protein